MSSENSTTTSSSRLSQFGIYRSIDARTEEFLRLSRKRQIRQGCACAAVSTAITVTIVVTVLLVYEYTMNLDSNPSLKSRMTPWHGIFNDTSPFELKYNKAKINIDPTTLKLLPLVLKALNQNRHLEKIIKDSGYVKEEVRNTNEKLDFSKNLFHGSKPTQSTSTADFKSVHPVNYKNTFNNMDYYRKMRQTNNQNRMFNYFDKIKSFNSFAPNNVEQITKSPLENLSTNVQSHKEKNKSIMIIKTKTKPERKINRKKNNPAEPKAIISQQQSSKVIPLPETNQSTVNFDELVKQKYPKSPLKSEALSRLKNSQHLIKPKVIQQTKNYMNKNQRVLHLETTTKKYVKASAKSCLCSKNLTSLLSKLLHSIEKILPEINIFKKYCFGHNKDNLKLISQPTVIPHNTYTTIKTNLLMAKTALQEKKIAVTNKPQFKSTEKYNLGINTLTFKNNTDTGRKTKTHFKTTIKPSIEPTYTTEEFQGSHTEPMRTIINETISGKQQENQPTGTFKHTQSITDAIKKLCNKKNLINFYPSRVETPYKNILGSHILDTHLHSKVTTETFKFLDNDDNKHSRENDNIYIFPFLEIAKKPKISSEDNKRNTLSLIDWIEKIKIDNKKTRGFQSNFDYEKQIDSNNIKAKKHKTEQNFINQNNNEINVSQIMDVLNEVIKDDKNIAKKPIEDEPVTSLKIPPTDILYQNMKIKEPIITRNVKLLHEILKNNSFNNTEQAEKKYFNKSKYKTTIRPKTHSEKYRNDQKSKIEPYISLTQNPHLINEINMYDNENNNNILPAKKYPNRPKDDKNHKRNANETKISTAMEEPTNLHLSDQSIYNLKSTKNITPLNDTKHNNLILQQNKTSIDVTQNIFNKIKFENNSKNKVQYNETISSHKFSVKKETDLWKTQSRKLFSKFAEINNLLYKTKNISNLTIYEKFHARDSVNYTDENNTLSSLEYDEFMFLNDEIREKERENIYFSEIDKYKIPKPENGEDSGESTNFIKSMLPVSRPIFLEIQRNDWKHDNSNTQDNENHDTSFE